MPRLAQGLSLVEMLLALGLLAVLLSAGLPDFQQWRRKREIDASMRELLAAIDMARAYAIAENVMVTLCRSNDGQHCQGRWLDGAIVFTDRNADRVLDAEDRLFYRLPPFALPGTLSFSSFQNRQYLQMTARGFTNYQNGNFTFCPADGDLHMAQQIIVSLSGRSRLARDSDGDGIVEDSQGRALTCN
jgi:type IV fimbrial biogenesis protein FimT